MVQNTIGGFFSRFESWLANAISIFPFVLLVLGLALVLALVLYSLHREGFEAFKNWLTQQARVSLRWLPIGLVVLLVLFGIKISQYAVGLRYVSQNNARFSKLEDPPGHDTVQQEPSLGYTEIKNYTRSIRVPPNVLKQLDSEGREAILPYVEQYLADPQSRNVRKVVDSIVKNGKSLFFVREAQILEQSSLPIESSNISTKFEFGDTGVGRSFYRASFQGQYGFSNPNKTPLDVVFYFPFPDNSGVLTDFEFEARGETAKEIRPSNTGFTWYATLKPNEKITAQIKYKNQGSDTWNYKFTGRTIVNNFNLEVQSPKDIKFLRGSLYPTEIAKNFVWKFPKIVTSQGVVLSFPETSLRETLSKTYVFMQFAIILSLAWLVAFALRHQFKLEPYQLGLGLLVIGLGLSSSSVFFGYVSPGAALWIGAILAAILGTLTLGTRYALPVVLSSLSPLVFLSGGNSGLWLLILALVAIASILPKDTLQWIEGLFGKTRTTP
jgi:hypothetical protein